MKVHLLLLFMGILLSLQAAGQYTSKDNHTGLWSDPNTWVNWAGPYYTGISTPVNIDGFVESSASLSFDVQGDALVVRDTLIIYGDLSFANKNNLVIEAGGILVLYGDLSATNKIEIAPEGYLIVQGNIDLNESGQAETTNDGDNVFVGGTISPEKDTADFSQSKPDSEIGDEDGGLDDFYKGKDPNNELYSIRPDTTDICSRTNPEANLYFTGGNQVDEIVTWQKSTNPSDETSWVNVGDGSDSYTANPDPPLSDGEALYCRVSYTLDGTSYFSDTAVVYCGSLCTMTASIPEPDQTACYAEDVSFNFTSTISDGTAPYNYSWEITSADDPNVGDVITQAGNTSDQITYSNFSNPEAVSWNYTVTLTATDAESCESVITREITLQRRPETGNTYYVPNEFDQQ